MWNVACPNTTATARGSSGWLQTMLSNQTEREAIIVSYSARAVMNGTIVMANSILLVLSISCFNCKVVNNIETVLHVYCFLYYRQAGVFYVANLKHI
jgi:hypothetical protein